MQTYHLTGSKNSNVVSKSISFSQKNFEIEFDSTFLHVRRVFFRQAEKSEWVYLIFFEGSPNLKDVNKDVCVE